MRIVVGISGASGAVYGIRLLEELKAAGVETHLVVTAAGELTIRYETGYPLESVHQLATHGWAHDDIASPLASGSFRHDGMVVAPCSIKSVSGLANSYAENLLLRAGDVALKERRKLVLLVRETPLHSGHLEAMLQLSRLGAVIMPPLPSFYNRPQTVADVVNQTVGRVLDLLGIPNQLVSRWTGGNDE